MRQCTKTIAFCLNFALLAAVAKAEPEIKNVLLLVSDDLKASVLGCYENRVCQTPNLDRLASQGMVFERAYCQGTSCRPSRISFMRSRHLDSKGVTLGEHFISHGVYSARVGKIFHMRVPGDIIPGTNGDDVPACWTERFNTQGQEAHTPGDYACLNLNIFTTELEGRESTRMKNRMFVSVSYDGDGADQPDFRAAEQTIALLRDRGEKPFFIATGFVRPHYPNVAPKQYFDLYPHDEMKLPETPEGDLDDIPKAGWPGLRSENSGIAKWPENIQRMWAAYYATVTFMDEQVGKILDELERLGLRDSTAIVFTSDHGYHLGEHTFWQKSNLHEESVRVPLIISAPGLQAGRSGSIVELVDIFPTICELTGMPIPDSVEGKSLMPILTNPEAEVRDAARSFVRGGRSLRGKKWAYMRYAKGEEELYDMEHDPGQFTNLARNPEKAPILQTLREKLAALENR